MKTFRSILAIFALCLVSSVTLTSCYGEDVDSTQEAVFTYQPWIWGHGGIDMTAGTTGRYWCWASTHVDTFSIIPVKHQVNMDDLFSNESTPLDFHTMIKTQIIPGKSPILLKNYGKDWFDTNLYNVYCKKVRNHVSQYSQFDLFSNREVLDEIDQKILKEMQDYVALLSKDKEFPVIIKEVTIGKAIPNGEQLAEMNATAREIQAKQTEERRYEAQKAREAANRQTAVADKAYMNEMNFTPSQYLQYMAWQIIEKKQGANIDVMFNADDTQRMWNIRR